MNNGPFRVSLNGTAPERPDAPLPLYPGRRNTLEVRAAREAPDVQVWMRAETPDRRTFTRTIPVAASRSPATSCTSAVPATSMPNGFGSSATNGWCTTRVGWRRSATGIRSRR